MRRLAVLALGILVAACSETPTETPTMDAPPVAMSFTEAPAESGVVYRGERPFGLSWWDGDSGLRLTLGVPVFDICFGAGGGFELIPFQRVDLGDDQIVDILQGDDVEAIVSVAAPFACPYFTTPYIVATGTADYVRTDNDYNLARPNASNAYGSMAHGTVTLLDGTPMVLSGHIRQLFMDGQNRVLSVKVQLSGPDA